LARRSTFAFSSLNALFGAGGSVATTFSEAGFFTADFLTTFCEADFFATLFAASLFAGLFGAAFFTPFSVRFTLEGDFAWLFFFEVFFEDGAMEPNASAPPHRPEADSTSSLRTAAACVSHAPMRHDVTLTIFSDYV
jgi:hypothetical protein